MAYVAYRTWVTGAIVTASQLNQDIRDNGLADAVAVVTTLGDLVYATAANTLARLPVGASNQVIGVAGGIPTWGFLGIQNLPASIIDVVMPWMIDVDVLNVAPDNLNWSIRSSDTGFAYGSYLGTTTTAQNNQVQYTLILAAGTWTVRLMHNVQSTAGIYNVKFNSGLVGTIDGYSASLAHDVISDIAGIVVAAPQKVVLQLIMATKNASASAYGGYIKQIKLIRTA